MLKTTSFTQFILAEVALKASEFFYVFHRWTEKGRWLAPMSSESTRDGVSS